MNNKDFDEALLGKYRPTIGLEIHAELATKTKMFCRCENNPDLSEPNVNICPVCTAQPGTLPTLNKQAIESVIRVGLAMGSQIADFTEWDRKNYFYPDIPKGYQISQKDYPLVSGGSLRDVELTRIHLEEDTGKNIHKDGYSLIDYNRAGVPLMELVTEPCIHSGEQATTFAKELQLLLRTLGVSHADMEKGHMRVEANISVSATDDFGTKTEVKNLNSFKVVGKAIDYEIRRQIRLLEAGEKVVQETRGWDEDKQATFSQRLKEDSHDYRYFPDPDLPKLMVSEVFDMDKLEKELPELPWERRERYLQLGLDAEAAEIFVVDLELAEFFEEVIGGDAKLDSKGVKLASNYITSDLLGLMKKDNTLSLPEPAGMRELVEMVLAGDLSSRGAKDTLEIFVREGGKPQAIAEQAGLIQKNDTAELEKIATQIIADNGEIAEKYRAGEAKLLQFFIGQGMKATKGSANPQLLGEIFKKLL